MAMSLSHYFLSPRGRIGRQEYWLGMLALTIVTLFGSLWFDPDAFSTAANTTTSKLRPPSTAGTLWSLAILWPTTAVAIKRFNDRDWPDWVGYAVGAGMGAFVLANYFGFFLDPDRLSPAEKVLMLSALVAFLWAVYDNGFKPGTPGPNRYGPDPLPPA